MPHVVTQACCGDASCVHACPVNCIHPTPDEPDFATAEMLYIDPDSCVDCGACVSACPVGAISPHTQLDDHDLPFVEFNAAFHQPKREYPPQAPVIPIVRKDPERATLRVAIVGAGPAALYAADELLKQRDTEVTVIDRLPTPYGLVRAGVAPDHQDTKKMEGLFRQIENQPGFRYLLGVDVGNDITMAELGAHHHAVIAATGASQDRSLGIAGEDLVGSITATDFVAWYNGHPDHVDHDWDLSGERVVIIGNGNVALDCARILTTDPEALARTDIADHALETLRTSNVREVIIVGRRAPAQAAFTLPELTGLVTRADMAIETRDAGTLVPAATDDHSTRSKLEVLANLPDRPLARRRITLAFHAAPVAITGTDHVRGIRLERTQIVETETGPQARGTGEHFDVATDLVMRSVGYRGVAIGDWPFDDRRGVVQHERGAVRDGAGNPVPGAYVTGWIKRGPSGFIGTNKADSRETVDELMQDFNAGMLDQPTGSAKDFAALVQSRQPAALDLAGWRRLDKVERAQGARAGRPRQKLTSVETMREFAVR